VDGSAYDQAETKHYFYWFFEKRSTSTASSESTEEPVPLLIWLNGGPGCSSMLGLLTENGPCLVNEAGDGTTVNPYSWNEVAHVLFLDQPATVGYSYGRANDSTDEMMAEDAYYFIQSFLQSEEGQKYQGSPLYLTGESYAGHYIPAIAHRILEGNNHYAKNNLLHVPLAGLAIGNPWTDPVEQNKWYAEYAKENNLFTAEEIQTMEEGIPGCVESIQECEEDSNFFSGFMCQLGLVTCNGLNLGPPMVHNVSLYDITKPVRERRYTDV
jgi:cathepsin A (carboxypeptidase C)